MSNKLALFVSFVGQNKLSGEIRNIVRDSKQGAQGIKKLATEAARLEKELDKVNRELRETSGIHPALLNRQSSLRRELDQTTRALADQRTQMERIQTIERRAGKVGTAALGAGAVATTTVTVPVIAGAKASIDQAMDVQELNSAFAVTFGKNAAMMDYWAERTGNMLGRSTQEMKRFSNSFGLLFTVAAPEKAAEMSANFAVLAQDIASFNNVSNETAAQSLMSGLSGEAEPLRKFGVFLTEGAVKAKALAMGLGGAKRELTDQEKIQARYALILEATTKAQGDVIRTSGSATNKLKALKGQWEEQQVAIGNKLLPLIPPLADALISVLTAFNNLSPGTQKFIAYAVIAGAALGPLLVGIGGLAFGIRGIAGTVGGAVTLFTRMRAISLQSTKAFGLLKNGFGLLRVGALGFARAMLVVGRALLLNPIGFLVTAVAVAAFAIWYNWDKIKAAFATGIGYLSTAWTWLKTNARNILQFSGPIGQAALFIWDNWALIKKAFGDALAWIGGKVSGFIAVGRQIIDGLVAGINAAPGKIWAALKGIIGGAWQKSKEFLGIASPSRLFSVMGGHISAGLAVGIDRGGRQPLASMKRMTAGIAAAGAMSLSPMATAAPGGALPARGQAAAFGGDQGKIEINIYASDGQSPGDIAKEVMRELEKLKGVRKRSDFGDDE